MFKLLKALLRFARRKKSADTEIHFNVPIASSCLRAVLDLGSRSGRSLVVDFGNRRQSGRLVSVLSALWIEQVAHHRTEPRATRSVQEVRRLEAASNS